MSIEEVAMGFVRVANETMCRPIRALTQVLNVMIKNLFLLSERFIYIFYIRRKVTIHLATFWRVSGVQGGSTRAPLRAP